MPQLPPCIRRLARTWVTLTHRRDPFTSSLRRRVPNTLRAGPHHATTSHLRIAQRSRRAPCLASNPPRKSVHCIPGSQRTHRARVGRALRQPAPRPHRSNSHVWPRRATHRVPPQHHPVHSRPQIPPRRRPRPCRANTRAADKEDAPDDCRSPRDSPGAEAVPRPPRFMRRTTMVGCSRRCLVADARNSLPSASALPSAEARDHGACFASASGSQPTAGLVPAMDEDEPSRRRRETTVSTRELGVLSVGLLLASDGSYRYALTVASARPSRRAISAIVRSSCSR